MYYKKCYGKSQAEENDTRLKNMVLHKGIKNTENGEYMCICIKVFLLFKSL